MSSRRRAREIALQILYRYDVARQATGMAPPQGKTLADELAQHFDHFGVPEDLREFSAHLVAGTLEEMPALDQKIEEQASNWKVARMGFVDRSLLRMALYELTRIPDTPVPVVIDQAIELAKQFGTADTPAFVNGILDALKNSR